MNLVRKLSRFRRAEIGMEELTRYEQLSRGELSALQLDRINRLWAVSVQHVAYYRRLREHHGLPERFNSLAEFTARVPVLDKESVRSHPERFLSDVATPGQWHRTSGSTGVPMTVFWSQRSHQEDLWCRYRMEQQWGVDFFDRKVFLWGHPASFAPGLTGKVHQVRRPFEDWLRNRLRLSSYRLSEADLQQYLRRIDRFAPKSLYGHSTAVLLLAKEAQKKPEGRRSTLQLCILSGEPSSTSAREEIGAAFGCAVAMEYGSVECGIIATEGPDQRLRLREDRVFVETLRVDDECHEMVLTVFGNPSFPLVRYRIGDVIESPLDASAHGFTAIPPVFGRRNDFLIAATGRVVHPNWLKNMLEQERGVRRFQVHQQTGGQIVVRLEAPVSASVDVKRIRRTLQTKLGAVSVEVSFHDALPLTRAGKHRWIVSDLPVPFG